MFISSIIRRTLLRLALPLAFTFAALPAQAQTEALPPPAVWPRDAALQVKVSFEALRQPLPQVLGVLQEKSGVPLQVAANSPAATAMLTARTNQLPLLEIMQSLSKLYGVRWEKQGDAYVLSGRDISEADLAARRTGGEIGMMTNRAKYDASNQRAGEVADELYDSVEPQQWKTPRGVPVAELPATLQEQLRRYSEGGDASNVFSRRGLYLDILRADPILHLGGISKEAPAFDPFLTAVFSHQNRHRGLFLMASDGRFIMPLFPSTGFSDPQNDDNDPVSQKKMKRLRDLEAAVRAAGGR